MVKKFSWTIKILICSFIIFFQFTFFSILLFSQSTEQASQDSPISSKEEKITPEPTGKTTTITIQKAQKTSSRIDDITDRRIIVLSGGVIVSVLSEGTESIVSAEIVNYDRDGHVLFAQGDVSLEKKVNGVSQETLTASSLLLNTDTLEGVFNDGRIVQLQSTSINVSSGSTLIVSADVFGRDNGGTITFKNSSLTLCDDENPHWQIKASRIWLLSGNEFAFANALLYVGHVPILYLPFFYYPKDEMVFNPVFGYRKREGYFVQTTTYLIGRKPLNTSTSTSDNGFFDFLKETELKKQERQGLFLHNFSEKETETSSNFLKILADYYTNLGGMIGIAGGFKPKTVINDISFNLNLGFSRTIFPYTSTVENKSVFLDFSPNTGKQVFDSSNFIGMKLPFRYGAEFKISLNYNPFRMTISLPIYSDPYFKGDFQNRSESMDWIGFLMQNPTIYDTTSTATQNTTSEVSSFSWRLTSSITPSFDVLKPYVSSLQLKNLEFALNFNSKVNDQLSPELKNISPSRKFYYPATMTPSKISVGLSGTIFSWPLAEKKPSKQEIVANEHDLETPKALLKQENENNNSLTENITEHDSNQTTASNGDIAMFLPKISLVPPSIKNFTPIKYSLTYSVSPDFDSLITYFSASDIKIDTIKWNEFQQSFYKIVWPVNLTSSLSFFDAFLSLKNAFTFSPVFQRHPFISPSVYSKASHDQIVYNDYAAESRNVVNSNTVQLLPFLFLPIITNSSLSWNTTFKIVNTKFIGTANDPLWEYQTLKWDKDFIPVHNLSATISATEGNFSQSLTLQANLPPLTESYSGLLSLKFPYVTLAADTKYSKTGVKNYNWVFEPLNQSASIKLFDSKLSINQSFKLNIENKHPESFQVAASFSGLSTTFLMLYSNNYKYEKQKGWVPSSDKQFLPYSVNISFSKSISNINLWKNRISIVPGIQTTLSYDLIRFTNSYFTFSPSLSLKIYDFASLTFSSTSRNDVIFRYIQSFSGTDIKIPGEQNIWLDLMDSFSFHDELKRQQSGFKLKSFSIKLEHYLHDWTLSSEFSISPRLLKDKIPYYYDFSPYFSVSVLWKPMNSMKTTIVDKYGELQLNP